MAQPENRRIAWTKHLLQEAFLKLLKTKPIHAISIRELCSAAGINRTTFYNHYGSQYDLLEDISQQYLDCVAAYLRDADAGSREGTQQRVTLVLRHMADNRELSALLLNHTVDPAFAERLFSLPQVTDLLDAALTGCTDPQIRTATVSFAIYGSFKLLRDWLNNPDPISPEDQADLILRLARRVCTDTIPSGKEPCHVHP